MGLPHTIQNGTGLDADEVQENFEYFEGEDWHEVGASGEPAFENGWSNHSATSTFGKVRFKKVGNIVYIAGLAVGGTVDAVIFTLPVKYRPTTQIMFSVQQSSNTTSMRLDIQADGKILQTSSNSGGNTYISLYISFIL